MARQRGKNKQAHTLRPPKRGVYWVICGPDPYLATCQRCGAHVDKPKLPMPLSAFVKYMEYAVELHHYCKENKNETHSPS